MKKRVLAIMLIAALILSVRKQSKIESNAIIPTAQTG